MIDVGSLDSEDPETPPQEIGWYPGIVCWDANEGGFPSAFYWDGKEWNSCRIFSYKPHRFETEKEADKAAEDANLGW
jgi:hypothetical protein